MNCEGVDRLEAVSQPPEGPSFTTEMRKHRANYRKKVTHVIQSQVQKPHTPEPPLSNRFLLNTRDRV